MMGFDEVAQRASYRQQCSDAISDNNGAISDMFYSEEVRRPSTHIQVGQFACTMLIGSLAPQAGDWCIALDTEFACTMLIGSLATQAGDWCIALDTGY